MLSATFSNGSIRCWSNLSEPMYSWLQDAIAENAEVITASRRLARELRGIYDAQQLAAGRRAWLTPPVRSWHDWLNRQSSTLEDPTAIPARLDNFSSSLLMERSLRKQMPDGLPGFGGIVRQASQAWQRLREWQVPLDELKSSARGQDERAFAEAAADYAQQLSAGRWVDSAGMAEQVAGLIERKEIVVPAKLVLAGFDRLSPAANRVTSALTNAGCTVVIAEPRHTAERDNAANVSVQQFASMESELRAAGAWARTQLEENPDSRIAIVSPILESGAAAITRLIREGLVPGWQYGGSAFESAANVSYGRKLSEYPAISIALLLIRWIQQGLTSRELSLLLRSRCVGGPQADGRSRIELTMRRYPDRLWTPQDFLSVLQGVDESPDSVTFLECVTELSKVVPVQGERVSPSEWARRIDATLTAARWPGDMVLDSREFQLVNRWRELLNEFAGIEVVMPRIDLADSCQRLTALASETLYQPESGRGLVRVLGTLEAAGMEFDSLWISGLDASQWPPASRPASLISNALQRKYSMPDATPGDTLSFAKRVLDRLTASAGTCMVSWALIREDAEVTASSLLEGFSGGERPQVADPGWYAKSLFGRADVEVRTDDVAPQVAADEHVRGGAYTVQRQHEEPFSAFVYGRLGVRPLEPITPGLSPGVRGNIIHNALHNLLAGKPTQVEISAWSAGSREQRIGSAIDSALAEHARHADPVLRRIIGLERSRLRQLLQDFIQAEFDRPEFAVVDVEKAVDYEAFGVRLGLRIDRIDRLANDRLLIIDYKTGLPKSFLDRAGEPTELQLIVYAEALQSDIGGLALINVDSRAINYKGAGGDGGPWKARAEEEWNATLDSWRRLVQQALQDISAGDVRINLLHSASESRPLNILSRKEEQRRAD